MPQRGSLLPIFGVDVIAIWDSLLLVALDLAPADRAAFDEHVVPILQAMHALIGQLLLLASGQNLPPRSSRSSP
jgi:hypothetical protein